MATPVLFISESYLKDSTLLHENIDFKYLRPIIIMCQDINVQPKLGSTLYDEIKTQIIGSSLTTANQTLLDDYIQPCLRYWIESEAPTAISYKFLNKGLMQQSSENASTSSLDEINFISQKYQRQGRMVHRKVGQVPVRKCIRLSCVSITWFWP
jgi:hypothetical protein